MAIQKVYDGPTASLLSAYALIHDYEIRYLVLCNNKRRILQYPVQNISIAKYINFNIY